MLEAGSLGACAVSAVLWTQLHNTSRVHNTALAEAHPPACASTSFPEIDAKLNGKSFFLE